MDTQKNHLKETFLLSTQNNVCYGYSKEPSQRDLSFKHPKQVLENIHMLHTRFPSQRY